MNMIVVRKVGIGTLFLLIISTAFANPVGGVVNRGVANFSAAGNLLTINQSSSRAIINWGSFNIGRGETTVFQFNGPAGANSAVLNRVNVGNPSTIAGMLRSTVGPGGPVGGTVLIINPSGMLFTPTAQVNVGGLVASTLSLGNDQQFLDGSRLSLSGSSTAGIINQGNLSGAGDVYLIANTVRNEGTITAGDHAGLAAGTTVTLAQSGKERLTVLAGTSDSTATTGVENTAAGKITAVAAELKAANGNIYALAINNGGVVRADTIVHEGGHIYLRGGSGKVVNSGSLDARGTGGRSKGGEVQVTGREVVLAGGSSVDVSGTAGGGTALIGGDFKGANPDVQNANHTVVEANATIRADALQRGDGGNVAVWSDGSTEFGGVISARALDGRGNGGRAEISGREHLTVSGHALLQGSHGANGTLLLDPGSVLIDHGANEIPPGTMDTFHDGWVNAQLALSDLTISTANSGNNASVQTLTVDQPANIAWNAGTTLNLFGLDGVFINGSISHLGSAGGLNLTSPNGPVAINKQITAFSLGVSANSVVLGVPGTPVAPSVKTTGGGQIYNGPVLLAAETALAETGNGGISFRSTINAANPSITSIVPGNEGAVPGVVVSWLDAYHNFHIESRATITDPWGIPAGTVDRNYHSVFVPATSGSFFRLAGTAGQVGADYGLTLSAPVGGTTFGGAVGNNILIGKIDVTGPLALNGRLVQTLGSQTYNNAVTLGADTVLKTTGGGSIAFRSTIDAANPTITSIVPGSEGAIPGFVVSWLDAYHNFHLESRATITDPWGIPAGTVDRNYHSVFVPTTSGSFFRLAGTAGQAGAEYGLTLSAPVGGTTFGGAVGNSILIGKVDVTGPLALNGRFVQTLGPQTYNNAVTLGGDTVLTSKGVAQAGDVTFNSTVDSQAGKLLTLVVNAPGVTAFRSTVGGATDGQLGSLTTDDDPVAVNGLGVGQERTEFGSGAPLSIFTKPDISGHLTTGAQTYNDPVLLKSDAIINGQANGTVRPTVTFASTVDGSYALRVNTGGETVFDGNVGNVSPLQNLTTDNDLSAPDWAGASGERTIINVAGTAGSPSVKTVGAQTYNDPVGVFKNTVVTSTGRGAITFGSTIDSDGLERNLDVYTGGETIFDGQVGYRAPINNLTTDNDPNAPDWDWSTGTGERTILNVAGTTAIPTVKTYGSQEYKDPVMLFQNTVLSSYHQGNIIFRSTVDGNGVARNLEINTGGITEFDGQVGYHAPINDLTTDNDLSVPDWNGTSGERTIINVAGTTLAPSVKTYGDQTYNDPVVLGKDTVVSSYAGGNITFGSTLDSQPLSAWKLEVNTGGQTRFNGLVGNLSPLSSLTTDNDPLVSDWNGTSGERTTFAAATPQGFSTVKTSGSQMYNDPVVLEQNTVLSASAVHFAAAVDGDANYQRDLTVNALGGMTIFNGPVNAAGVSIDGADAIFDKIVGGFHPIGQLTVNSLGGGVSSIDLQQDVTTSGSQTYLADVRLSGNITLSSTAGGAIAFNKRVDSDTSGNLWRLSVNTGGQTRFNGLVGSLSSLSSLTTDNDPLVPDWNGTSGERTTFAAATPQGFSTVKTTGAQVYNDPVVLEQSTVLTASAIRFAATVDGDADYQRDLTVNALGGLTIFNGPVRAAGVSIDGADAIFDKVVGGFHPIGQLTVNSLGGGVSSIDLQQDLTTSGPQTYLADVRLSGNITLSSTAGGAITFNKRVDSDTSGNLWSLTVNTAGNEVFNGVVGGFDALSSLTTDNNGAKTGQTQFNMDPAGAPTGKGGVNAGTVTINDQVAFNVANSSARPSVLTVGDQTYNDAAVLHQDTVVASSGKGTITFFKTVDADNLPHSLTVNTGGETIFDGNVGNGSPLLSLTTDNDPSAPDWAGTSGERTIINVAGTFGSPSVKTVGAQTYNDPVGVFKNTVVTSTGRGAITFGSTIDSDGVERNLDVNTGGETIFDGQVGYRAPINNLTTDNDPSVPDWDGTSGERTILNVAGTTLAPSVKTYGFQQYNDPVVLSKDTVVSSYNRGSITFGSTVDGALNLEVDTGGNTVFNGKVGSHAPINSLITDNDPNAPDWNGSSGERTIINVAGTTAIPSVKTLGSQTYNDAVVLQQNAVVSSSSGGDITFVRTIDSDPVNPFSLEVNTSGKTIFNEIIGGNGYLAKLVTDIDGRTTLKSDVNANTVDFNDPVTLAGSVTVQKDNTGASAASVRFGQTIDADNSGNNRVLTVNALAARFDGNIGAGQALGQLTSQHTDDNNLTGQTTLGGTTITTAGNQNYRDAVVQLANLHMTGSKLTVGPSWDATGHDLQLTFGTSVTVPFFANVNNFVSDGLGGTIINGDFTTLGSQTYANAVTLAGATRARLLTSLGNARVWFKGTIDAAVAGSQGLTVNTGGQTVFDGQVGSAIALGSLTTDPLGTTLINGGRVNATVQDYKDAVTIGIDTELAKDNANNAATLVNFEQTVDGGRALKVDAVTTTFGGRVGGTTPLTSLTTDAAGTTAINGGRVNADVQDYQDAVTIGIDAELAKDNANNAATLVNFEKTVNGASALKVDAVTTTFGGQVGGTTPLSSLTTDAAGTTAINGGRVNADSQDYKDAVTIGIDTVLAKNNANNAATLVNFEQTVNGAQALTVNAVATTFGGQVGGTTPLTSMTTDATGTTAINGGRVNADTQDYKDSVKIGKDTTLAKDMANSAAASVDFEQGLDGTHALVVNAVATTFGGQVGGVNALASLTTDSSGKTAINGGGVKTTGSQTYNDDVTLGAAATTLNAGAVTLAKTVNGASALTINAAGQKTFGGAVGNTAALTSLITDGAGTTVINGGLVNTTGSQTYNDDVSLGAASTALNASSVTLAKTVNGASALTITSAGQTTFDGAVGNNRALVSLTTDAAGTTVLAGGSVRTSGAQTYNDPVLLANDTTLTDLTPAASVSDKVGNITFNNTVDGRFKLKVNTEGNEVFNGVVGGKAALTLLETDDPASKKIGGRVEFNMNAAGAGNGGGVNSAAGVKGAGVNIDGSVIINDATLFNLGYDDHGLPTGNLVTHPSVNSRADQRYVGRVTLAVDTELAGSTFLFQNGISSLNPEQPHSFSSGFVLNGDIEDIILTQLAADTERRVLLTVLPKAKKGDPHIGSSSGEGIPLEAALVPIEGTYRSPVSKTNSSQTPR